MPTVLLSAPYMIPEVKRFEPVFAYFGLELIQPAVNERLSEEELLAYAGQFDAAICGDDRFTERVLQACAGRLKVISKWGTGIDSIDRQAAARLGIQVRNTPNAFTLPVADTTLGYILLFARKLLWMDERMKQGQWEKAQTRSLAECTLGVIGVGNVGKAVLRRGRAFGMRLLGNDIIDIAADFLREMEVKMLPLEQLLQQADFVSLHCDLNPSSYHLINKHTLSLMKPTAVLINTARGPIIDEPALIEALRSNQIAGAALDVFENEPLPHDSPLLAMKNVFLAPHNANASPMAWERVHWNTIRNALEGLGLSTQPLESLREQYGKTFQFAA